MLKAAVWSIGFTHRILCRRVRASLNQRGRHLHAAALAALVQGGAAIFVDAFRVRLGSQQRLHNLHMALLRSRMQSSASML